MDFSSQKRIFQYLTGVLSLLFLIVLISKVFFEAGFFSIPQAEKLSQPLPQIPINWDILRSPLKVYLPEINVVLEVSAASTSINSQVDLTAKINSQISGIFKYSFDCDGDGSIDFPKSGETIETSQKEYKLQGLCKYEKAGTYNPKVYVKSSVSFFNGDKEITEIKSGEGSANLLVSEYFELPEITSCDISAKEGTTQKDALFLFSVEVANDDGNFKYEWDFGDGSVSFEKSPKYSYKQPGAFIPKVSVFTSKGAKQVCIVNSLLGLQGLNPFETIGPPKKEDIGRENPFAAY